MLWCSMSVALERRQKHRVRKRGAVLLETTAAINAPSMPARQLPNILITGTPGTGKTTHSELVAAEARLQHVNIGALVREHELYDGYNEEFEAYFVNDDKVCLSSRMFGGMRPVARRDGWPACPVCASLVEGVWLSMYVFLHDFNALQVNDHLEDMMAAGGVVVDHHSSDFFPERFFDLVVVLQTDNTLLYDRLKARGYSEKKIQENVQCEIMHVPCEEAQRSYRPEVVQILSLSLIHI